jgi:PPOX class probable F420-dependent enzyme
VSGGLVGVGYVGVGYGGCMATMTDADRDTFLQERRVGVLAIAREGQGPLVAPIWYRYVEGVFEICMGGSTAKARLLRARGRASICVQDEDRPYRYVSAEGPVDVVDLGAGARDAVQAMAARYLGEHAGQRYAEAFKTPDEVMVRLTVHAWRTEVLG